MSYPVTNFSPLRNSSVLCVTDHPNVLHVTASSYYSAVCSTKHIAKSTQFPVLWSGLVSLFDASHRDNLIASFPLGQNCLVLSKIAMTMTMSELENMFRMDAVLLFSGAGTVNQSLMHLIGSILTMSAVIILLTYLVWRNQHSNTVSTQAFHIVFTQSLLTYNTIKCCTTNFKCSNFLLQIRAQIYFCLAQNRSF